ncbi:MAG: hypothetical protein KDD61_02835, partial [Bdellovibrionales bacterium]|nr:hypothetical protein [Bdellovibrionales bacterium]
MQINKINFQRIVATAATAWKELGLTEFEKHVVVVERRRRDLFPTILIRRTPWTEQDLQDIQSYLNNHPSEGYRISVHPFEDSKKWYLKGGPTPERYARSHIDLRPTRDDRPFFSNNQKPFHRIERPSVLTEGRPEFNEVKVLKAMGPIDIIDVALIVFALAVLLLIMSSRHVDVSYILRNPLEASHLFFIGAGFIFIEFLFLYVFELISHSGQVTLVLVIGVLTLSAGLSQFLFRKWHWDEFFATPKIGFVLSVSLFLFGLLGVDRIGLLREISSYGMRYFVVILVISYFGVLLGHFFPAALKRMGERGKLEMGWILNALGFVVGGVCSIVLFQALGFRISCMILSG